MIYCFYICFGSSNCRDCRTDVNNLFAVGLHNDLAWVQGGLMLGPGHWCHSFFLLLHCSMVEALHWLVVPWLSADKAPRCPVVALCRWSSHCWTVTKTTTAQLPKPPSLSGPINGSSGWIWTTPAVGTHGFGSMSAAEYISCTPAGGMQLGVTLLLILFLPALHALPAVQVKLPAGGELRQGWGAGNCFSKHLHPPSLALIQLASGWKGEREGGHGNKTQHWHQCQYSFYLQHSFLLLSPVLEWA